MRKYIYRHFPDLLNAEVSYFVCFITLLLNLRLLYIHLRIQLRRPTDSSFKLQKPLEESTYIPPSHEQSHPRSTIGGEELFGEGHRISRTTVGRPEHNPPTPRSRHITQRLNRSTRRRPCPHKHSTILPRPAFFTPKSE